jgi:general secretion pathway protein L
MESPAFFRAPLGEGGWLTMTFASIRALWRRWIEVLTLAYFAWREARRARQALIVACESGRFVVRKSLPGKDDAAADAAVAVVAPGEVAPTPVTQAARNSLVVFELPADVVVVRRVAVPVRAREFLAGIIRNQLERLSPWYADEVVYGFDADVNAEDPASLDVRVFIALRSAVEQACQELDALGLPVDRVVTHPPVPRDTLSEPAEEPAAPKKPVALWSRLADASPEHLAGMCRQVGAAIAAMAVVSLGVSVWAVISAASLDAESEGIAVRARTLQRQIQGPASMSTLNPRERVWYAKETSPTAAIVLEALSRALPDGAYLTELRLEQGTVRLIGLTSDAPSLIAPLERSGHLTDVRFFAPTTRGPDGSLFRFNIEAHVEPHFRITENGP